MTAAAFLVAWILMGGFKHNSIMVGKLMAKLTHSLLTSPQNTTRILMRYRKEGAEN